MTNFRTLATQASRLRRGWWLLLLMGTSSLLTFGGFFWHAYQADRVQHCRWSATEPATSTEAGLPVRFQLDDARYELRRDTLLEDGAARAIVQTETWRPGPPKLQLMPLNGGNAGLSYRCETSYPPDTSSSGH